MNYTDFLNQKAQLGGDHGFSPNSLPDKLFPFQAHLTDWACRKGRDALFADCGMGKTFMQLAWAEQVVKHTNGRVLIAAPLAVGQQTVREGEKLGVEVLHRREGLKRGDRIVVTNYERLHLFDRHDFTGVVCDESSILKNYAGATRNAVIDFLRDVEFRLLCTATPSPNDFTELGNSVEALGIMRRVEMLAMFFTHDGGDTQKWRLKGHGRERFWRFLASWARAIRMPSDLGFSDEGFVLPELRVNQHCLPSTPRPGNLFALEAIGLAEQRAERRETIGARCDKVAEIANADPSPFVAWCSLNAESERLTRSIDGAVEVRGSQTTEEKEELLLAFASGEIRCIVTKPRIAGFGLNWQHCHRISFFPSHSHEEYYQAMRRCYRFGQASAVDVNLVTTEAESPVVQNMLRKEEQSIELFESITAHMRDYYTYKHVGYSPTKSMEVPAWLRSA